MHRHHAAIAATIFLGLAIVSSPGAHAGVRIQSSIKRTAAEPAVGTQTMYVADGRARIETPYGGVVIFKNDALYVLDVQRKSYLLLDGPTLERLAITMNEAMERMRAQSAAMPPEQRAMMEQMLAQRGMSLGAPTAAVLDARATGKSGTFRNKPCKLWEITRGATPVQQVCAAPFSTLPGVLELRTLQKKMSALLAKAQGPMRQQWSTAAQFPPELIAKIDGYPVIIRTYVNGQLNGEEATVTDWQSQAIDNALFDIPTDFTKQDMPTLPQPAH